MKFSLLFRSATTACFECGGNTPYFAEQPYRVLLDGVPVGAPFTTNVFSLFELAPDTAYTVTAVCGEDTFSLAFCTERETCCVSARDFFAVGDGSADDTRALQGAIDACPSGGRVLVPAGVYRTGPLTLKSCLTLELADGATLLGSPDERDYAVLPGAVTDPVTGARVRISSWEGEPKASHRSLLSAFRAHGIRIVGRGTIDGNGGNGPWWIAPKERAAGRPRLLFLNDCEDVTLHGVTCQNAASWQLHPYFSRRLGFYDIRVLAPADSPNTDGCDPESCDAVQIIGAEFSVGDDAIAIKSGKIEMGRAYRTPASRHTIRNCRMRYAHGAVVLGSEMSGGVRDLAVTQCLFEDTDRGLRIKTRRGRGEDAVIDGVSFSNIRMDGVKTPLVINMFYFCDRDGKSDYVQSRLPQPVDARTPRLGSFSFSDITATGCAQAAGFFYGLPEQPIGEIRLENVSISCSPDAEPGFPAMLCGIEKMQRRGLCFLNVGRVTLKNVSLTGCAGEPVEAENVGAIEGRCT